MKSLEAQLQDLKRQVDAAPWLKWAGVVIVLLLAFFIVQGLESVRVQRQKMAIETELNLRQILALKGQEVWFEREKRSLELRDSLQAQLPNLATPGMAQAALQAWLRTVTSGFAASDNVTIRVNRSGPVENIPGVLRVNAALNGALSPRQALGLLRQIENSPNLTVVETITLQTEAPGTLNLTINAYYRVPAGEAK